MKSNMKSWKDVNLENVLDREEKEVFDSNVFKAMLEKMMASCDEEIIRLSSEIRKHPSDNELMVAVAVRADLKKKLGVYYNLKLTRR